ncbi:MAG TPA: acyl-CoA dehydrogenase family protein [Acidimicrobiales bacterium]|nr:acyl-CoA dehydrogenase family protein [Acidimicrobiales bacterium]
MDFRLTEQQVELQDAVRAFCEGNYAIADIGAREREPLRAGDWQRLVDLDVFRLAAPTASGGLGQGIVEAAVVYEVLGGHLVPGPLVWSALAAIHLPGHGGAARIGGHDEVDDESVLIDYGQHLDLVIVLRDDGVFSIPREDLGDLEAVVPTDPLTPVARARNLPRGTQVGDPEVAAEMRNIGAVLASALLLGIADRALQAAVGYAGSRHQFGKPIGSFQAIKHLLADMYVRTMLTRSATYAAAAIADDRESGDFVVAASAAKLIATDAAIRNAKTCIQVHGGMGFTWEMIPHYLLKRAWVLEHAFGSRAEHADRIATDLASEVA